MSRSTDKKTEEEQLQQAIDVANEEVPDALPVVESSSSASGPKMKYRLSHKDIEDDKYSLEEMQQFKNYIFKDDEIANLVKFIKENTCFNYWPA